MSVRDPFPDSALGRPLDPSYPTNLAVLLLIPVAAGVLAPFESLPMMMRQLHPILAALAMAMSSFSVVSNSLRLYRAKIN